MVHLGEKCIKRWKYSPQYSPVSPVQFQFLQFPPTPDHKCTPSRNKPPVLSGNTTPVLSGNGYTPANQTWGQYPLREEMSALWTCRLRVDLLQTSMIVNYSRPYKKKLEVNSIPCELGRFWNIFLFSFFEHNFFCTKNLLKMCSDHSLYFIESCVFDNWYNKYKQICQQLLNFFSMLLLVFKFINEAKRKNCLS